ncbi:hypothetical protein JW758_04570 [Candidatus Peregrinibacteria bacterium]|nr:hypothetical protein [Candidatus Peregrinibacteria bacterium]
MKENREVDAAMEILQEKHFGQTNIAGKPVVGWQENSEGVGGIHNPRGYAMVRAVISKLVDGDMSPLYDQPIIVESPGSIIIAQKQEKVGLIQSFRMVGKRIMQNPDASYIEMLQKEKRWSELISSLGRWCWEAPRGLIPPIEKASDLEAFILKTAKMEALEEAGYTITNARIAGMVNANPTFFPHAQYVVNGEISSVGESSPEDLEIIGENRLFTMKELREMNMKGEFDDGLTLAGLALCGKSL